jgi:hypothetical protein
MARAMNAEIMKGNLVFTGILQMQLCGGGRILSHPSAEAVGWYGSGGLLQERASVTA